MEHDALPYTFKDVINQQFQKLCSFINYFVKHLLLISDGVWTCKQNIYMHNDKVLSDQYG